MKRSVPLFITFAVGMLMIVQAFVPAISDFADLGSIHFDILAAIAFILGGGNLVRSHGEKVAKRQAGWGYSGVTLAFFALTLIVGTFKIGVAPNQGFSTWLSGSGDVTGIATMNITDGKKYELILQVSGLEAKSEHAISIAGQPAGTMTANRYGRADIKLVHPGGDDSPPGSIQPVLAQIATGNEISVGGLASGSFVAYGRTSGDHLGNGSAFWFLYEYGFKPLQSTMFAMLAFYVASAAFRAFRARNVESVLLLGTAFIILLGRTYAGTVMTAWLPAEGAAGFFTVPHLTQWIMMVLNTAGSRAIMIGIALGVASTSLKVLLGIDRSYLGSDRE